MAGTRPVFITLTGGNIGWQVGVQSTDVVLVFKTRQSVNGLLSGKVTLGADAAVAAGPVGRQAAAATDTNLGAQIYSYSRSRGLFAGVSFDGSVIRVDRMSNGTYYRAATPGGPVVVPASARTAGDAGHPVRGQSIDRRQSNRCRALEQLPVARTSSTNQATILTAANGQPILAQQYSAEEVDRLRDQLARLSPEMYGLLDVNWQQYLGLPVQVFRDNDHPTIADLNQSLAHLEPSGRIRVTHAGQSTRIPVNLWFAQALHSGLSHNKPPLNLPEPPEVSR